MKKIVVGIDGSESANDALLEAARLARLEGAKLRLVTAWHVPGPAFGNPLAPTLTDIRAQFEQGARRIAEDGAKVIRASANGLPVDVAVREGSAAKVLLDAAADADLLVVGCRGHGGFAELLLGSVSHECARHAQCPVLVVHTHGANGKPAEPKGA